MTASSILWLLILIAFIVFEAVTINLVTIWFAVGAAAALISSAFTTSWRIQFIVFAVVSAVAVAATRPLAKKYVEARKVRTNADRNIGRKARVLADVTPDEPGRVRLDGVDWQARSEQPLPAGTLCEVQRVEGTTLVVCAAEARETAAV